MASTFFGLTIAASGLNTYQTALNTTGHNIANVKTKGYTRQEAIQSAAEALNSYASHGMVGAGVTTTGISQIRDLYYDIKYWNNNAKSGEYSVKSYYMAQFEDYFEEENKKGFTVAFDELFNSLDEVYKDPSNVSKRNHFINTSKSFAEYFNGLSTGLSSIQEDTNEEIKNKVNQINNMGREIASLTKQINIIELTGTKANDLRDQRALLVDQLSAIVPVEVKEVELRDSITGVKNGATSYEITFAGQSLVDTFEYNTLECVARENKVNQSDVGGLYDIYWSNGNRLNLSGTSISGELKALFDIRDGNNEDNFSGSIKGFGTNADGNSTVTIRDASITDINKMTMPETGTIILNNKEYGYTGFSYNSATGEYVFQLTETIPVHEQALSQGKTAEIGKAVDYQGIPYYMSQINEFVRAFASAFNQIHEQGEDLNGNQAGAFFAGKNPTNAGAEYRFGDAAASTSIGFTTIDDTYYRLTAGNFTVSGDLMKDPRLMATASDVGQGVSNSDIVEKLQQLKNNTIMFRGGHASEFLQSILSDIAVDTKKVNDFKDNYSNISNAIVNQRLSVSGVDEDEEGVNLVKFQNAYNMCAKMISVMNEIYNKLINETGV